MWIGLLQKIEFMCRVMKKWAYECEQKREKESEHTKASTEFSVYDM